MEKELSTEQWSTAIEKYLAKSASSISLKPKQVLHRIIMKKWASTPLSFGQRQSSNPNEEIVLFKIIADFDFYHRNKHRFEWLQSAYAYRNYGYEVYVHSYQAPEEVNRVIELGNRIKVCRRMITTATNKILEYQSVQEKSLFPNYEYRGYIVLIQKKEKYSKELEGLLAELKELDDIETELLKAKNCSS